MRRLSLVLALCAATGCSSNQREIAAPTPDTFAGAWRSVTPSLEFVGLSVYSKSSEQGAFGLRLTLSGLAWEGSGRIDADSLVAAMSVVGAPQSSARLVVRSPDGHSLSAQMRSTSAPPLQLTFVRQE
jgi:uncharacterized lipoprotein